MVVTATPAKTTFVRCERGAGRPLWGRVAAHMPNTPISVTTIRYLNPIVV